MDPTGLEWRQIFPAKLTGKATVGGRRRYAWRELMVSGDGTYTPANPARQGTTSVNWLVEANNADVDVTGEPVVRVRLRGAPGGRPLWEFDAGLSGATATRGAVAEVLSATPTVPYNPLDEGDYYAAKLLTWDADPEGGSWVDGDEIRLYKANDAYPLVVGTRYPVIRDDDDQVRTEFTDPEDEESPPEESPPIDYDVWLVASAKDSEVVEVTDATPLPGTDVYVARLPDYVAGVYSASGTPCRLWLPNGEAPVAGGYYVATLVDGNYQDGESYLPLYAATAGPNEESVLGVVTSVCPVFEYDDGPGGVDGGLTGSYMIGTFDTGVYVAPVSTISTGGIDGGTWS